MYGLTPFKPPIWPVWCGANSTREQEAYLLEWLSQNREVIFTLMRDSAAKESWPETPSRGPWDVFEEWHKPIYLQTVTDYFQPGALYLVYADSLGNRRRSGFAIVWPDCTSPGSTTPLEGVYLLRQRGPGTIHPDWAGDPPNPMDASSDWSPHSIFSSLLAVRRAVRLTGYEYPSLNYPQG